MSLVAKLSPPGSSRMSGRVTSASTLNVSARCHANGAVQADALTVEIGIAQDLEHQARELRGCTQAFGKRHGGRECHLDVIRSRGQQRSVENSRQNGIDADPLR